MEQQGYEFACSDFQPTPCFLGSRLADLKVREGRCYKFRLGAHFNDPLPGTLTIDYVDCPVGPVEFLDPSGGTIDARRPHPPSDPLDLLGVDTLLVEAPAGADALECWSLCETAVMGDPNYVARVADNGDGTFTVYLDRPITTGAVTAITYTDDDDRAHAGIFTAHPGDANGDGRASPADILFLIDVINSARTAPWGKYSTDCDHSGAVGPTDILCIIDLLNGAGTLDPWLNRPLPWPDGCEP
jgi:hypothetical protein